MTMRHDDGQRDRERLAIGRARLQARLTLEADRAGRSAGPAGWLTVAAVAALTVAAAALLPWREEAPRHATVEPDALPVATYTPGATIEIDVRDVCDETPRPPQEIGAAVRQAVLRNYGMEAVPPDQYELDYLITPQLGGAPDARNLWPQRYRERVWNAGVKDQLEDLLPRLVCEGRVDLRTAQRDIAADWVAAYRKYFGTAYPMRPAAAVKDAAKTAFLIPERGRIDYHKRFLWQSPLLLTSARGLSRPTQTS
jgi:hypothetical protein